MPNYLHNTNGFSKYTMPAAGPFIIHRSSFIIHRASATNSQFDVYAGTAKALFRLCGFCFACFHGKPGNVFLIGCVHRDRVFAVGFAVVFGGHLKRIAGFAAAESVRYRCAFVERERRRRIRVGIPG